MPPPVSVLSIAGSDSCGGAGIQADLKTFAAFGVDGATVVTAVTAQNANGIRAIQVMSAAMVRAQLESVFEAMDIRAVKLGMLANAEIVAVAAEHLQCRRSSFVVHDPVLHASSGTRLLDAAEGLVLERGLAGTSVDDVLSQAGSTKGAFFHHFSSKAALGRALVDRWAEGERDHLDRTMARAEAPALVLMDMSLPGLDGWEATRQLKAAPETRGIPVIGLTAHAMAGDREKALAAGCDDFDTKPVDLPRLLEKIEALLRRTAP